jgi:hypothetical protein
MTCAGPDISSTTCMRCLVVDSNNACSAVHLPCPQVDVLLLARACCCGLPAAYASKNTTLRSGPPGLARTPRITAVDHACCLLQTGNGLCFSALRHNIAGDLEVFRQTLPKGPSAACLNSGTAPWT